MTEEQIQEAEEQPNDPPEVQEPEGGADTDQEVETDGPSQERAPAQTDTERRAREYGWLPKDQYTGRPESWVPAEEYMKPVGLLRQERNSLKGEVDSLKRTIDMVQKDTARIAEENYQRGVRSITERQRQAVADGDVETFDALEKQKAEIKPPAPKPDEGSQPADPEVQEWVQANPWVREDEALRYEAAGILQRLMNKHPHMAQRDRLDRMTAEIKRRYPEDFGIDPQAAQPKPQYQRPQKVSGTETRGGSSANGAAKGWSDIPQADREVGKSLIGEGKIYKTQADYAKSYWRHYE